VPDVAVPIAFPDYLVTVDTPAVRLNVPDWLPRVPNEIRIPRQRGHVPYLGHAGILFFNSRGLTKYFEFGRYDPEELGLVVPRRIPDLQLDAEGKPTLVSLSRTLNRISLVAGHSGRIEATYIELPDGAFAKMLAFATARLKDNTNPKRVPYDLTSNSCLHFMKLVAEAGGAQMPRVIDPRPGGYIERVRSDHPDLDFKAGGTAEIEGTPLR
jgi:hypothetical protein